MTTPREPLSPEERALAQRLASVPSLQAPGPALDASILAAARAAVEPGDTPVQAQQPSAPQVSTETPREAKTAAAPRVRRARHRRWTLGLGVAASVLLAVTLSWQLRPQRTVSRVEESAPAPQAAVSKTGVSKAEDAALHRTDTSAGATMEAQEPRPGAAQWAQPTPPSPEAPAISAAAPPPPAPQLMPAPAEAPPSSPVPSPSVAASAEPTAPAAQAPQPASIARAERYMPPAPPAPPAPMPMPDTGTDADIAAARKFQVERSANSSRDSEPDPQQAAPPAVLMDRAVVNATPAEQAALADDRRLPPDQWLRQIRRHRFEGNGALARASLQAFQHMHPDQAIPEDLRTLLP